MMQGKGSRGKSVYAGEMKIEEIHIIGVYKS